MEDQKNTTQLLEQLGCKLDKIIYLLEANFMPQSINIKNHSPSVICEQQMQQITKTVAKNLASAARGTL